MGCRHRDRDKDVDTLDLAQKIEKDMILMCVCIYMSKFSKLSFYQYSECISSWSYYKVHKLLWYVHTEHKSRDVVQIHLIFWSIDWERYDVFVKKNICCAKC